MRYPLSRKYDEKWIVENQMGGPNPLIQLEWTLQNVDIQASHRVMDLGCGKALTSIFLAREFGCQVFAPDLWIDPSDNFGRIQEAGLGHVIFPIRAEARELPYPNTYFDRINCTDAFIYFGTDDLYISYIQQFLKPGGIFCFTIPGAMKELPNKIPAHLVPFWADECWTWHTVAWWHAHVIRSGYFEVLESEVMADGVDQWIAFKKLRKQYGEPTPSLDTDIEVLTRDGGEYMGFIKIVARKKDVEK